MFTLHTIYILIYISKTCSRASLDSNVRNVPCYNKVERTVHYCRVPETYQMVTFTMSFDLSKSQFTFLGRTVQYEKTLERCTFI